jgi:hypothetical protein
MKTKEIMLFRGKPLEELSNRELIEAMQHVEALLRRKTEKKKDGQAFGNILREAGLGNFLK